jgi:hypothetical protein
VHGRAAPRRAEKSFGKARTFLERAIGRTRGVTRRLLKKDERLLNRAQHEVDAAALPTSCRRDARGGIDDLLDGLRSRIGEVLSRR